MEPSIEVQKQDQLCNKQLGEKVSIVLLFSGKRKSGKDYLCEKLKERIGPDKCEILRISSQLKKMYAKHHQLDWKELMTSGPYKEKYRSDMIQWSDKVRKSDYGFFCRAACENAPSKKVWLVSDIRRKTDIQFFEENFSNLKTVRISTDEEVRRARGWKFTEGVDDVASECDLDDFENWDKKLSNNNDEECENCISQVLDIIKNEL